MAFLKGLDIGRLKGAVESGARTAREGVANIKVDDIVQGARDIATTGKTKAKEALESVSQKSPEEEEAPTFKDFIALLWCLANVDGVVSPEEREKLSELASNLDEEYGTYAAELEQECALKLQKHAKEFGQQNAAKIEAQMIIESLELTPRDAKLLCWNLLALANSDGLEERELDFMRFANEKAGVDSAAFEELRNYSDAIVEIERAREQLKASNRSYGEIEPLVSEFTERERLIIKAAQSLVTDR